MGSLSRPTFFFVELQALAYWTKLFLECCGQSLSGRVGSLPCILHLYVMIHDHCLSVVDEGLSFRGTCEIQDFTNFTAWHFCTPLSFLMKLVHNYLYLHFLFSVSLASELCSLGPWSNGHATQVANIHGFMAGA